MCKFKTQSIDILWTVDMYFKSSHGSSLGSISQTAYRYEWLQVIDIYHKLVVVVCPDGSITQLAFSVQSWLWKH